MVSDASSKRHPPRGEDEEPESSLRPVEPSRLCVVVVDRDTSQIEKLALLLAPESVVYATDNARDALELVSRIHPNVVITDYGSGPANGLSLLARLQRRHPSVVRVLFTAHDQALFDGFRSQGVVNLCVPKASGAMTLVKRLRDLLGPKPR